MSASDLSGELCVVRLIEQTPFSHLFCRVYELSGLNPQKALSIAVSNLPFVGGAHGELVQEIAR